VKKKRALYFGTEGVVYKPTSVAMSCHLKFVIMCTGHTNMVLKLSFFYFLKIKQKQKGSDRILMPSVEGQQAGKWVVIDSGNI
jgi:ribosomal silencing factor RsfS